VLNKEMNRQAASYGATKEAVSAQDYLVLLLKGAEL
jgi:hypothetical protein